MAEKAFEPVGMMGPQIFPITKKSIKSALKNDSANLSSNYLF